MDKWDYRKLKALYNKRNGLQTEETKIEWEKNFASYTLEKGLITRTYREPKN
jgi:hypothetical protein